MSESASPGAMTDRAAIAQLVASERRLRADDRRKDAFISVLSHELRNPLAAVQTALWVLEQSSGDPQVAKEAQQIAHRQIRQLQRLVDDLLDVSRLTRNDVTVHREPIDLVSLLRDVVTDMQSVFDAAGLTLDVSLPTDVVCVEGDAARLVQTFGNLLHNAAKFTDAGGVVRISLNTDGADAVTVTVADNGRGIAPQSLASIFQPYVREQEDPAETGLGLGLAIAARIVQLHGGSIHARSDGPGTGSTFTVRLQGSHAHPVVAPTPDAPPRERSLRVLFIDDDEPLRAVAAMALRSLGHTPEVAASGPQGLTLARESRPDVVLCDIGLPGMSGYEVAHAFRTDPQLCDIPLLALSGYSQPRDIAAAQRTGFDAHLAKPLDPVTLQRRLLDAIEAKAHMVEML